MDTISPVDFADLSVPRSPRLSPDGSTVAFLRRTPADAERYETTVYTVPTDSDSEARRFSLAAGVDSELRWSPSGDRLAVVSTRGSDDDRPQLWIIPTTGGEGRQITQVVGGVSQLRWSPDGTSIAFVQRTRPLDRDEGRDRFVPSEYDADEADPRVIDRTVYRSNQRSTADSRRGVYAVDVTATQDGPTEESVTRIAVGDTDFDTPTWEDQTTLYVSAHWVGPDPDDSTEYDIVRYDLETGSESTVHRTAGWGGGVVASGDGRLAVTYSDPDDLTLAQTALHIVDTQADTVTDVTAELDRTLAGVAPVWGPDRESVYFLTPDEGTTCVWRASASSSSDPTRCVDDGHIDDFDVGPSGAIAVTMSEWDHPGDVFHAENGSVRRLTHLNASQLESRVLSEPERLSIQSAQGPVDGWLLRPPSFDSTEEYPLIVEVHGGPHSMWSTAGTMWHEFQSLAAAGYVVLWTNPRGSAGYGAEYMRAIERNWGDVTLTDVMAGVDHVTGRSSVDEDAVFITGGSFGGFLTAWAIGSSDRFRAAVAQRGVYDLLGFYGSTDGAYKLIEGDFGTTPWSEPSYLWEHSPVSRAASVSTPTLVLHSDRDYRTPASGAELFHRVLRKTGTTTRFVRYPREGHELSRSGEPAHVIDRIERIVRWFDGYSPAHEPPPAIERDPEADLSHPFESDESTA